MTSGQAPAIVRARAGDTPASLLAACTVAGGGPRPVIVVCGGADGLGAMPAVAARRPRAGIVAAARETGACVVDGGTAAGVMDLMGAARARDRSALPVLLGVAPAGKVDADGQVDDAGARRDRAEPHERRAGRRRRVGRGDRAADRDRRGARARRAAS